MGNDIPSLTKSFTSTVWRLAVSSVAGVAKTFSGSREIDATAEAFFQFGDTLQRGVIDIAYAATAGFLDPRYWGHARQ